MIDTTARKNELLGDYLKRKWFNAEAWFASEQLDRVMDARFLYTVREFMCKPPMDGENLLVFEQVDGVLLLVEIVELDIYEDGKPLAVIKSPEQAEKYSLYAPDWLADVYSRLRTLRPVTNLNSTQK